VPSVAAHSAGVAFSITDRTGTSYLSASDSRPATTIVSSDVAPSSNTFESSPTGTPSTSAQTAQTIRVVRSELRRAGRAAGVARPASAARSTLPPAVSGKASTTSMLVGTR
jgi:hypothetical protein